MHSTKAFQVVSNKNVSCKEIKRSLSIQVENGDSLECLLIVNKAPSGRWRDGWSLKGIDRVHDHLLAWLSIENNSDKAMSFCPEPRFRTKSD